jgi:PAS domain S-box-containing protein
MIKDISNVKKAENSIIREQETAETYLDLVNVIIVALDREGIITMLNKKGNEVFERTADELIGKNWFDYCLPPNERDRVHEYFEAMMNGEMEVIPFYENSIITKSGHVKLISWSTIRLTNSNGEIIGALSSGEDITERKHAQQKLKESEEKYRYLIENALEGVWAIDSNANTILVNPSMANILGYTVEEMIGKSLFSFMDGNQVKISKLNIENRKSGIAEERDVEYLHKNGNKVHLRIRATPIFNKQGNYDGAYAFLADITQRKITEQKLRESQEKFSKAFHSSPNMMAMVRMNDGTLLDVNDGFLHTLGYEYKEVIGRTSTELNIWAKPEQFNSFVEDLEALHRFGPLEILINTKKGKKLTVILSGEMIMINNEKVLISIANDITEKKNLEEIKSNLLTRFSHEFKTPIISIKGFTDLLLKEYKHKLDDRIISFLLKIKEGGEKLKLLVNSFIESSQLDEKLAELKISKQDLSDLIIKNTSEMQALLNLRNHVLKLDIQTDLIAEFDKDKINSVISNLLLNSINYTPLGGKIIIYSEIRNKNLIFSIKDNGIGLTDEEKKQLFKPFGKIERYGKGWDIVAGGMGVGLYLSKEIIDLHRGKIWAESEGRNNGSTFYFSLPITNNN